ncbi:MAG: hypothetical protein HUJ29_10205 [Gammaproteobacteria bacterium]|nr:hypothetical protein [Gammaproteobacteria bacterium]
MTRKTIIYVPGKNPKPEPEQHKSLLWRSLIEGVRRADPTLFETVQQNEENFHLIAWNYLYYKQYKDITVDIPWIDALMYRHGPSDADMREARQWHRQLDRLLYNIADRLPFVIKLMPEALRTNAEELNRYFNDEEGIAREIREPLKQLLRPRLQDGERILLIGHSMGSVIAYDALWDLSHEEQLPGKLDCLLTIGSPLGMNYVQKRLRGAGESGTRRYPTLLRHWINLSSVGDVVALDRNVADDFQPMMELGLIDSIEDHCSGIYNFFRNDEGLNCHRSYGYLVNPAVGAVITRWWQGEAQSFGG